MRLPDLTTTLAQDIGHVLLVKRLAARMTQRRLAESAGLSQSAVTKIERGVAATSVATIETLFAALGLRLQVSAVPSDAIVDAAIAHLQEVSWEVRIERSRIPDLFTAARPRRGDHGHRQRNRLSRPASRRHRGRR